MHSPDPTHEDKLAAPLKALATTRAHSLILSFDYESNVDRQSLEREFCGSEKQNLDGSTAAFPTPGPRTPQVGTDKRTHSTCTIV